MNAPDKCRYYEWDEADFTLSKEFSLSESSELADALNVFWSVGGLDFFNLSDPRYYASNWLDFVGGLYARIVGGEFDARGKAFTVPLNAEQKKALNDRGVPSVFITDIAQPTADIL